MQFQFRKWLIEEAAKKDSRKGVAFKQKSLDDLETGVFASRLADKLGTKPSGGNYSDFLYRSVRSQGDVLGDLNWEKWEVTKAAMELGGIDPAVLDDPNKSLAERLALINRINWQNVTLPALKARLGPSFKVPNHWKTQFGIELLKNVKAAVEQGQPITDPKERRLLGIWRTLEVQLGGEGDQPSQILPAGPKSDVGMSRLPMSRADRTRFYKTLTGTNEAAEAPLQLSAQSAYDYLTGYGMEVVSDEEAKDLYLTRILNDLRNKEAFIPSSARGSEADRKRWRDSASRSWGGFLPPARFYDPGNDPGFAQFLAGMSTRSFQMRRNPSGRRVPAGYNEPEEVARGEMPTIKYSIDVASQEVPDEAINAFYGRRTPESTSAVETELVKPARDAVNWLKRKGWDIDPAKLDDYVQQVVMGMLARTGSVKGWRGNTAYRRSTAAMLARRFASQGWPLEAKEKTGRMAGDEDHPGVVATTSQRSGGDDEFSRIQRGAARARDAIHRAIAFLLDTDTSQLGSDEEKFVDALDSLSDPDQAMDALDVVNRISARHAAALPQVRRAVERIKRQLEPLLGKVRGG
jgi:hypothetical protein